MSLLDELKKQVQEAEEAKRAFQKPGSGGTIEELVQSVAVPVEIKRDGGKLRMYLNLDPGVIADPYLLNSVLDMIEDRLNLELAVWRPKSNYPAREFKNSYRKRGW